MIAGLPAIGQETIDAFARRFGSRPSLLVRSPGRVNLIGEHTDYNEGFVLPMAVDRAVWIALRPRRDRRVRALSLSFEEEAEFALDDLRRGDHGWAEYLKGMAWALAEQEPLVGWEGVVGGDVPVGAGLASSAAVELAAARAYAAVADLPWEPRRMAVRARRAENEWVGVQCGIMDQLVAAAAVEGAALLIDCRSLETAPMALPPGVAVAVLDTSTRRGLVDSAYNERRAQCQEAARRLGVSALRDLTPEQLVERVAELGPLALRRARHVVSENARTLAAAQALTRGDTRALRELMEGSHRSLRDDFQVSSPALDAMVDCAGRDAACLGARMTGAGFGGCVVALVRAEEGPSFIERVTAAYRAETGLEAKGFVCGAAAGAEVVPLE